MSHTPRQDRRVSRFHVTPESEDAGLFKNGMTQVDLVLVPIFGKTARGDITVRGYVDDTKEVSVVFAGRRKSDFSGLKQELRLMLTQANFSAAQRREDPPPLKTIRLPVQIEGSWRQRFERDASGDERRTLQFLAARWAYLDRTGASVTTGKRAVQPSAKNLASF